MTPTTEFQMRPAGYICACGAKLPRSKSGRRRLKCDSCRAKADARSKKPKTTPCAQCGTRFVQKGGAGRGGLYCERSCKDAALRNPKPVIVVCHCGGRIRVAPGRGRPPKYCAKCRPYKLRLN